MMPALCLGHSTYMVEESDGMLCVLYHESLEEQPYCDNLLQ